MSGMTHEQRNRLPFNPYWWLSVSFIMLCASCTLSKGRLIVTNIGEPVGISVGKLKPADTITSLNEEPGNDQDTFDGYGDEDFKMKVLNMSTILYYDMRPGEYLVIADAAEQDDWSDVCVAYTNVFVSAGGEHRIDLYVPTNALLVSVEFGIAQPEFPGFGRIPLRVDKLMDKEVDPVWKQWLWVSKTDDHTGKLRFVEIGSYRITAFSGTNDLASADLFVNQSVLTKGKASIILMPRK